MLKLKSILNIEGYLYNDEIDDPWYGLFEEQKQILKWIKENPSQEIFLELGTGGHHIVGKTAAELGIKTIGITLSVAEVECFKKMYEEDNSLMRYYHVVYMNWYYFDHQMFPKFDAIFALDIGLYPFESANFNLADKIFLKLVKSLKPNGKLFLGKSRENARRHITTRKLINKYKDQFKFDEYLSLTFCQRKENNE